MCCLGAACDEGLGKIGEPGYLEKISAQDE